jgi:hypothetical protein
MGAHDDVDVPLVNAETGQRFHITWVDNTATSPGDGTFENPFTELPDGAPSASHILVRTGVGSTVGNITLADNQHFWGEGREYVLRTTRIGDVTIPDQFFKQTGPAPQLFPFDGTKPVVTLAELGDMISAVRHVFTSQPVKE